MEPGLQVTAYNGYGRAELPGFATRRGRVRALHRHVYASHQTSRPMCLRDRLKYLRDPWAEEGEALLEKAAGQGHVHAMQMLGGMYTMRMDHERALGWFMTGAEAGLPEAMISLGCCLHTGEGVAAPDSPAAAGWYRRAADAGHGQAAYNLHCFYTHCRGRVWKILLASSSSTF